MHEYVTVSSSSYDPASLATKLTEKATEGWTVVAIVPTGGDVTAFLSRESSGTAPAAAPTMEAAAEPMMAAAAPEPTPEPVMQAMTPEPAPAPAEPAGWAVAPEPAPAPVSSAPATVIQSAAPMADIGGYTAPAAPAYQPAPAPAPATPAVPAGWYADPAGRFDLRYWDGGTWTEHVSRAGQQFTDAPVA